MSDEHHDPEQAPEPSPELAMTVGEWRLRLAELSCQCSDAARGEGISQVLATHDLLAMARDTPGMAGLFAYLPTRAKLEGMLESGALESAVIALLPERASYILSRSVGGDCLASVLLTGMDAEVTAEAPGAALALLAALAACVAAAGEAFDPELVMAGRSEGMLAGHRAPLVDEAMERCGEVADDVAAWQVPRGTRLN